MDRQGRHKVDRSERLTVTLGKGQRARINAIAKRRRTSVATVIRWALDEYLAANSRGAPAKRQQSDAE
ncbi:MAG: hypothetical protein IPM13_00960 [Phycisphaerales bacterium]|nr:hypothetical protein [Phycisphaerales bacterium]